MTVKRAPPAGEGPASTSPPCESATALTIARPSPVPESAVRSAGPLPRTKREKTWSLEPAREPGAVVGDLEHRVARRPRPRS